MVITLHYTGIEATEATKAYVEKKLSGLGKFNTKIQKIEVDIGMRSHHHNKGKIFYAEANVILSHGMIRVVKDAEDLYKAIDKVKDHLKTELEDAKEKRRSKDREVLRDVKGYTE